MRGTVFDEPPGWAMSQIFAFPVCLLIVLTNFLLARKNDRTRDETFASAEHDKTRRRVCAGIYLVLAVISLYVVGNLHFDHSSQLELEAKLEKDGRLGAKEVPTGYTRFLLALSPFALSSLRYRSAVNDPLEELFAPKLVETRYFWWTQQYFAGLLNFVFFLITQSRVRKLGIATTAALAWMALTSLSFAISISFVYITLTPPQKNQRRFQKFWLMVSSLPTIYFYFVAVGRLSYALGMPLFQYSIRVCVCFPIVLALAPVLLPKDPKWRLSYLSIGQAQTRVFLPAALASLVLHAVSGAAVFWSNAPVEYHSRLRLLRQAINPSILGRCNLAVGNVIWALGDNPAVGAVGWDVILSFISLSLWTFVSSVSYRGMLRSIGFFGIDTHQTFRCRPLDPTTKAQTSPPGELVLRKRGIEVEAEGKPPVRSPFAELLDLEYHDGSETAEYTAMSMVLGLIGGLGVQSAGVFGAGARRLDA